MESWEKLDYSEVKMIFLQCLYNEDILYHPRKYRINRNKITSEGISQFRNLKNVYGSDLTYKLNKMLLTDNSSKDVIRILGFGAILTEHLILSNINLSKTNNKIIKAGAILNLIITLYDKQIDDRTLTFDEINSFSKFIYNIIDRRNSSYLEKIKSDNLRVVGRLVIIYLDLIAQILDYKDHHMQVMKKYLLLMYQSELATIDRGTISNREIRQKSCLPFVVKSLPSILLHTKNKGESFRRFRYSYCFGQVIGFIDDLVDIESDITSNNVNNILRSLNFDKPPRIEVYRTISLLIKRIKFINLRWEKITNKEMSFNNLSSSVLSTCIISWIGGVSSNFYTSLYEK